MKRSIAALVRNFQVSKRSGLLICFVCLIGLSTGILLQRQGVPHFIKSYLVTRLGLSFSAKQMDDTSVLSLRVRKFKQSVEPSRFDTERDSSFTFKVMHLPVRETAVVLIDVWASHPNDGWLERESQNVKDKVVPLLKAARSAGLLIIHAPHGHSIHPLAKPHPGEVVLNDYDADVVYAQLKRKGIKNLIYAGFASNWCVLGRPIGIIEASKRGFNIVLVRDASIAVETPESLDGEWAHKMAVNLVEIHWGWTTTVDEFTEAVQAMKDVY